VRTCYWCGRWFTCKQAVRGHLQFCAEWIAELEARERRGEEIILNAHPGMQDDDDGEDDDE